MRTRTHIDTHPHTRRWLALLPLAIVALALVQAHTAAADTYNACGVLTTDDPIPITCPTLPDAIAAATANPGPDTIRLEGGSYCPIALTGANGEISFVGRGFAGITGPGPIVVTGPEAEASTFTSHVSPCVATGYLVKIDGNPNTITFQKVAFVGETTSGVGTAIIMNGGAASAVGSLVLRDVIVRGNTVGVSFRGFSPSRFTMTGSTISGNTNGVFLTGVDVASITNSTFADNTDRGLTTGTNYSVELKSDTFTRNFIGIESRGNGSRVQMTNTIVGGNTIDCAGNSVFSLGHNLIGNFCGTPGVADQVGTGVTLAALNLNGGPTPTILPPAAAIGNGTNGSCPTTDQRGYTRTTGACDVGAVELNGVPPDNTPPTPNPLTLTFGSVTIAFDSVLVSGQTSVTTSSSGPAIPAGFTLNGSYYNVSTTAAFTTATLCVTDPSVTASSRLLHYPGPTDVTQTPVVPPQICSTSLSSFSPFAIVEPVSDTTPPLLSVSHAADGANGWNVTTGPVVVSINASDAGSGLAGPPSCTDTYNGGASAALTVTGSSPSFAASATGEGVHEITCTVSDVAGNSAAAASDTVKLDTQAPVVSYTGNAGTYTTAQTISITCSAADATPGSGLVSSTCVSITEPASNFTLGSHGLSADATDGAGNVGHSSTSFNVQAVPAPVPITLGGLCLKTKQFIQSSQRYLLLNARQKVVIDLVANVLCYRLAAIGPWLTPKQKASFVTAYKAGVQALVPPGWLTQAQATTLIGLANQL